MFKFLSPLKTFLLLKIIQDEINLGDLSVSNFYGYSPIMCHEILGKKIGIEVEVLDHKIRLGIGENDNIWDYERCYSANFTNYPRNCCKYITIDFQTTKNYRTKGINYTKGFNQYTALVDLNGKVVLFGDQDKYFEPAKVINNKYILLSYYGNEYGQRKFYIYSITGELLWSICKNFGEAIIFSFNASERVCQIDSKYFFILGVYMGNDERTEDIRIPIKEDKTW